MMEKTSINDTQQKKLREKGLLQENEIAVKFCDIFYAENILTGSRRILESKTVSNILSERKVLNG